MRIPFIEPESPRYIHINPVTNQVHLMVPVVGGQEISTDNTCQATVALREFFDGGALRELNAYKEALAFDIGLLEAGDAQRAGKEARLAQIEAYIEAILAMRLTYGEAMTAFLGRPSNVYSIQLRPRVQDSQSHVVNPVFTVNRKNDATGTPLSPLYNTMHHLFPATVVATNDPRTRLTRAVLGALPIPARFVDIQRVLGEQSLALLGVAINFTQRANGTPATQEVIDALMGFGADATRDDYIEALLGACAPDVWATLPIPPFYSIPATMPTFDKTEKLSILTQFFLANLNVYCKARGLSDLNFGVILDTSPELSQGLVGVVSTALTNGEDVERAICTFCDGNSDKFGLSRALHAEDLTAIRQTFERTYRTVTATQENPHMDDFMILDKDAIGETAKFVTHQGALCVNFAELIDPIAASSNPDYFASVRADFTIHPTEVPHRNECVAGDVEVDIEILLARINEEQFERLPTAAKEACRAHPGFQGRHFLHDVAKGKQAEAEALLTATPANTQTLLRTPGVFTDYSGRTFNCTAYEYAYWAKDTHMCRMLEAHMDEETKAYMLARIDAMEATGLNFQQNGAEHSSARFDFTPLKEAYQRYLDGYDGWRAAQNWAAIDAAGWDVGKAQRNVPAHVAHEYCRPGRSFYPCPPFNEPTLPRVLTFYNLATDRDDSWFPLTSSNSGLGFAFALIRAAGEAAAGVRLRGFWMQVSWDLEAITRLDEVRTADLTLSREHLNPPAISHGLSM
ncbi:TPA: hypothetical protein JBF46_00675 [Legionella pneumophila]|uniref:SidC N-terminal domain-containing protein n=1 Tax=Legionella pneumophila (strain Lens) TaxID=297245 RepID=Q5X035_LEGPL|nr:hypothetical protein [Legionella pneumophila]AMQ26616.1 hypothetical protein lpt_00825 [Legionella pneumophila subsp. pneumophila]AOW53119.1 hypothetical protein BE841_11960 [Legionella pneumophila subsp. pneumophila]AOW55980.1 hypothetical protein BE842_11675 [Legionella pneumophila subsp. pneumophila]AOW58428.1 hypothetical protein BE843_09270 [Legionella pneumophila subsp. pneumophila]AOW61389.1 hypothetical protein BE844_09500 [Legionella pneumophila subsp. pneumophila]